MKAPGDAVVLDLQIDVSRAEVQRQLGYPRRRSPAPAVAARLDALHATATATATATTTATAQPQAQALLRPRGAWRPLTEAEARRAAVPRPGAPLVAGLCTIGPALEAAVQRCSEAGEALDALILDAIGSAAAEAAADALCLAICSAVRDEGRWPSRRFSPGYGRWDVRCQEHLLGLLPAAEVGVHLTEGMMMVPRKSISFVVRLAPVEARDRASSRCAACKLAGCTYRQEEQDGAKL